jgi:DNA-binding MarR family transcriptional regulator
VRWLDEEEQVVWRRFLETVQALLGTLGSQLERDAGLSHAHYEILVRLSEADGAAMRMSDLAAAALFSRSRVSHAVARLELAGLVRREECPTDGRGAIAVLTPAGWHRLAEAAPGHVRTVRAQLFDRLSAAQVAELHRICEALSTPTERSESPTPDRPAGEEGPTATPRPEKSTSSVTQARASVERDPGREPAAQGPDRALASTVGP